MSRSPRPARITTATCLLALLAGGAGCGSKKPVQKATAKVKSQASARVAATPRPPPPPPRNADGSYTVAGMRYLEFETGGAGPNDTLPMVFALHGHGGDPGMWVRHFASYPVRARFIAVFGDHPAEKSGFEWMPGGVSKPENSAELTALLPGVEARMATALASLLKLRPTLGKPVITGFSQGSTIGYMLVVKNGDLFSMACPLAGHLPPQLLKLVQLLPHAPEIHAFQGDLDPGLPDGKRTIAALKKLGFVADFKVLRGVGHQLMPNDENLIGCVDRGVKAVAAKR